MNGESILDEIFPCIPFFVYMEFGICLLHYGRRFVKAFLKFI